MSIYIALSIMLVTGILGGFINFLLPANEVDGKKKMKWGSCVIIGIGATLLVPLFLQIAQSKLLENMHDGWSMADNKKETAASKPKPLKYVDTTGGKKDTVLVSPMQSGDGNATSQQTLPGNNPYQNYFLFIAYCLLASTAGYRFINMLIDGVLKGDKINKLETQNETLSKDIEKRTANSQISQKQEHAEVVKKLMEEKTVQLQTKAISNPEVLKHVSLPIIPELPPVIHPDDPQKGRFGGKAENNFRKISADVKSSHVPDFYKVVLVVESTDPANHPLDSDVIFYIHDSFSPSVFTYSPKEFKDGKAVEDEILSYGAFTVGIITDNGQTMLELDLAEDPKFPKKFRER